MINARGLGLATILAGMWFTVAAVSLPPVLPAAVSSEPQAISPRRRRTVMPTAPALACALPLPRWFR